MLVHLTANVRHASIALSDRPVASRLWQRLRDIFSLTLAACLMPSHLHLIAEVLSLCDGRDRLRFLLSGVARMPALGEIRWQPLDLPGEITDVLHLRRQVRYVVLNPCRASLTTDPLIWPWSTHRDVVGAVVDPWVSAPSLARYLELPARGFEARHHAYVSGDPSVCVAGTPLPVPLAASVEPTVSLETVAHAAVAATRGTLADIRRRCMTRSYFLALAYRHGWRDAKRLAASCAFSAQAVRKHWRRHPPSRVDLTAGSLCLGDDRLIAHLKSRRPGRRSTAAVSAPRY